MFCNHAHTKFQPHRHEWKCPACGAGPDEFVIESSVNDDCLQLHEDDDVRCYHCTCGWDGKDVAEKMSQRVETDSTEYVIGQMRQCPQVQYDLTTQLTQLIGAANKLGLYDAADYLRKVVEK